MRIAGADEVEAEDEPADVAAGGDAKDKGGEAPDGADKGPGAGAGAEVLADAGFWAGSPAVSGPLPLSFWRAASSDDCSVGFGASAGFCASGDGDPGAPFAGAAPPFPSYAKFIMLISSSAPLSPLSSVLVSLSTSGRISMFRLEH